ncbi:MAG: pilus assembly protein PilE [SAR86 cluster bacterium]|uniref:Pilus assembly protein PilE n=1 Tax=SAR86 cluster bacterium TaxID=2030880 RepID=A0A2A4MPI2_9GAMM|nr:MAG: pilus assembly protein PilE [SAR86 cluster bacterium]
MTTLDAQKSNKLVQASHTHNIYNRSDQKGFTLLEILIVVAIIGILMSIALPSYQESILRAGRAEAKTVLLQVAADQERFYSTNNSYSLNAQPLQNPAIATRDSISGLYGVTVAACGAGAIANCFVATATPQLSQTDDECTTLTLSDVGVRGSTGANVDECWQR